MIAGIDNHRIGSGLSAGIGIVLLILTLFFHVSCVDQKMTVKEAKQVTVSMGGKSFEPPPRNVDDILAVLDEADPVDHAMVYRLQETAASPAPSTADQKTRMMFYFNRGRAAYSLGRHVQALKDMREAYRLMEASGAYHWDLERYAGLVEGSFGNMRRSIEILEVHIRRPNPNGLAFWQLVKQYGRIGDLKAAERVRSKGLKKMGRKHNRGSRLHEAEIEYYYLRAMGKFKEAEPFIRRALELSLEFRVDYPSVPIWDRMRLSQNLRDQKRFLEAEAEARRVIREALALGGKGSMLAAEGLDTLGRVLLKRGRVEDARKVFSKALQIVKAMGTQEDSFALGSMRVALGIAMAGEEDFEGAMEQFDRARVGLETNRFMYKR